MSWSRRLEGVSRRHRVAFVAALGLGLLALVAASAAAGVADSPSSLQLFIGRLHPLIVHLPIGFILLSLVLEGFSRTRRFVRARHAIPLALVMSAGSAVVAVLAGYLLAAGGGYSGALVDWHMRLGIAVAVATLAAAGLWYAAAQRRAAWLRGAYTTTLVATVALVVAAGHLGGVLTRGPDYLTEYMPAPLLAAASLLSREAAESRADFTYPDEAIIYPHLVEPVLRARCVDCHGPDKQNGDLRLDSPEAISSGGTSGPVLVAGRAAESRMIQRVWLPPGHDEVMPPRGRQPLSVVEAELLRWWIDQGASFDQTMAGLTPPPGVRAILDYAAGPAEERIAPVLRSAVIPADSAALAEARELGVVLRPIARGSLFLRASCAVPESCGAEHLRALLPLADQLAELDLSGSSIGDDDMENVGGLHNLVRLALDRTRVGDAGLSRLQGLRHLEYLNLYGTAVTDAGLLSLESLASLRSVYLWQTGATPAGAERLTGRLPRLKVSLGTAPTVADSAAATSPPAPPPAR